MSKFVAVVPVKDISERISSKNFRPYHNERSLLEVKLKQLTEAGCFDEIYVSSDSLIAKEMSSKFDVKFIDRDQNFCNNVTCWSDVIFEVVRNIPENDETIISWSHVTSPLFSRFKEAVVEYNKQIHNGYNGLVSVQQLSEFVISEKRQPLNYSWGPWHKYAQFLDKYYTITGSLFMAAKSEMLKNRYVISTNPYYFESTASEAIDIDNEYDFILAQLIEENRDRFKNV